MALIPACKDCGYRHRGTCNIGLARREIDRLRAQKAELLMALRWYAETDFTARGSRARAAIATAKKEEAQHD